MTHRWQISRRAVLRGLGASMALPTLDAMNPTSMWAGPVEQPPLRMAFLMVPNGVHIPDWTPTGEGYDFELPYILEPLASVKDDLLVLTGLTHDKGRANGDGAGDHARACSSFLTGAQPRKTHGADLRVGISVDQFAAQRVGQSTMFPSLELGCDPAHPAGNCDSGYSCAYSSCVSWGSPGMPMGKETNPRVVFDRLFFDQDSRDDGRRNLLRRSILDFVAEDARDLKVRLGRGDQRKLDEYLTGVREIEQRIIRAERQRVEGRPQLPELEQPAGIPDDYGEHVRLIGDMMVAAFQCDLTRISSFMFANEGSNRSYHSIDVPEGHHSLSHHGGDAEKHAKIRKINRFHVDQFAYILNRLKAIKESDGSTLLDNCMVVYGSCISDGNAHNNENLPILLAGKGGGTLRVGRHLRFEEETPMTNLFVSMLDRMNVPVDRFGDSTGRLHGLT